MPGRASSRALIQMKPVNWLTGDFDLNMKKSPRHWADESLVLWDNFTFEIRCYELLSFLIFPQPLHSRLEKYVTTVSDLKI